MGVAAAGGGLMATLRTRTAGAHQALEAALDILAVIPSPTRMRALLERFYGFHLVWEPAVAASPAGAFAADRTRLPHLRADLAALGADEADRIALPLCAPAAGLAAPGARAIGSLYVLEGSTLGGQVSSRALQDTGWAPPQGLAYFDPYGRETGPRWRAFAAWAQAAAADEDPESVVDGANETFALLQAWLTARGG
jgi:heme oxygenase